MGDLKMGSRCPLLPSTSWHCGTGAGGKEKAFSPLISPRQGDVRCPLGLSAVIGEDEDAGDFQQEAIWSQHRTPTSISQLFIAPRCQQGKDAHFGKQKKTMKQEQDEISDCWTSRSGSTGVPWMAEDLQRASTHHTCGFLYPSIPSKGAW